MQESQALKMNITLLEMSRMASRHLAAGIFLLQTIVGILGNASLLYHYISPFFIGFRLRSTDLILKHLTIANPLVNLPKESPRRCQVWGWKTSSMLLDANMFSMFTKRTEVCPSVPPTSWVSSRPFPSDPGAPGGQGRKWELSSTLRPPCSLTGCYFYW